MHFLSASLPAVLLAASLLVTGGVQAETFVLHQGWDEMRATVAAKEYLPKVRVQTGDQPKDRIHGTLVEITDSGIDLARKHKRMLISRNEVHSTRLVPRKAETRKNRDRAILAAVPAGCGSFFGSLLLTALLTGGIPEGGYDGPALGGFVAAAIAVPTLIYRRAIGTDRGAVLIILNN